MWHRVLLLLSSCLILLAGSVAAQTPAPALIIVHTLQGHTELVYSVSFTPDGKHLVSGSFDKSVKLWDVTTGKEVKTFAGPNGHQDIILSTAVNPVGTLFASSAKDNTIKLWDFPTNNLIREFVGSSEPLGVAAVAADGTKLATAGIDGSIRLWNTVDGKPLYTVKTAGKPVAGLAISPNNQSLAASVMDGSIWLLNLADGKLLGTLPAHKGSATALAFHPNNQMLFTVGSDGQLKSWPLPLGNKAVAELPGKPTVITTTRSSDGARIALCCSDRTVRLIKADTGAQEKALPSAPADLVSLAIAGTVVAAGTVDGRVVVWEIGSGALLNVHELNKGRRVVSISLRSDGNELAASFEDGTIRIVEVSREKDKPLEELFSKRLPLQAVGATSVSYHPTDGNLLVTSGPDRTLKFWRIKEGKVERSYPLDTPATQIVWSKDGARLALTVTNTVQIHQAADGKLLAKLAHPAALTSASFLADGARMITASEDNKARLWDLATAKELDSIPADKPRTASLSPDQKQWIVVGPTAIETHSSNPGKTIAQVTPLRALSLLENGSKAVIAGDDGIIRLVNLSNGAVEKQFKGHNGAVHALAVTPNNQLLFSGGADKTLRAYTIADGKEVKNLPMAAPVQSLVMHPTGSMMVVGTGDKVAFVVAIPFTAGQPISPDFGKRVQQLDHAGPIAGIALTANTIYTASADKTVRAWKLAGDGPAKNLTGHGGLVDAAVFSPDGQTLASCSHDGTVKFWNPADGKQISEVKLTPQPQPFYCLAWRPDGKQVAVGGFDHGIRIVDVAGKKVEREIKGFDEKSAPNGHRDAVYSVAYTPNGQQLYAAGADGQIKLWNLGDGGLVKSLIDPALKEKAQRDWINQIKLTTDGGRLVSVGNGGWITIWNTADGKLIHVQKLPSGLYGTAITADGKLVATGNQNGTVYVMKMP